MEKQSSRDEVTPREFTNEYHFGNFRGDALQMLRRGYDVHLHFANFGIRKLLFRLPQGPPWDQELFDEYVQSEEICWHPDTKGAGGVLGFHPEGDAGTIDYHDGDLSKLLPRVAPQRGEMMRGDLRPLYVMWLATTYDDEQIEPPLPAGLREPNDPLEALADFYEVSPDLIAAAENSGPAPKSSDLQQQAFAYLQTKPETEVREFAGRMLSDASGAERLEIFQQMRRDIGASPWSTAAPSQTVAQLHDRANRLAEQRVK